jgi:hypothetical protein
MATNAQLQPASGLRGRALRVFEGRNPAPLATGVPSRHERSSGDALPVAGNQSAAGTCGSSSMR